MLEKLWIPTPESVIGKHVNKTGYDDIDNYGRMKIGVAMFVCGGQHLGPINDYVRAMEVVNELRGKEFKINIVVDSRTVETWMVNKEMLLRKWEG